MDFYAFGSGLDAAQGVGPLVREYASFYGVTPIAGETPGVLAVNNANSYINIVLRDPVTNAATNIAEGWIHFRHIPGYNGGAGNFGILRAKNSGGNVVMRIAITGYSDLFTYNLQYGNGTTFTTAFSAVWSDRGVASAYDIYFKIDGALGVIQAFSDGVLVGELTGVDTSMMGDVATVELTNCNNLDWGYWGWIVATGGSTIGHYCRCKLVTGDGPETDWTGAYTDVNEWPQDTNNFLSTDTAGQKSDFTSGAFSALASGNIVKAVGIGARVRNNGATPSTVRGTLRIGGTDYTTADCAGVSAGWSPARMLYPQDPSTSAPWTGDLTNVNVVFGIGSRT